ncbi:MAG: hypothetical protein HQK75_08235 [Candidatus Magnetomorum sp.]|nr:hypothetical protein [Candidatus Magnetomorum sp.]
MKKLLLIAGMIMAVMMVVQPTYAATSGTFNITVTISTYTVELLKHDGMAQYNDWGITVPPGGAITMVANDAVMVSLTGADGQAMDIITFVSASGAWNSVMPEPGQPLAANEFVLIVDAMNVMPTGMGDPLAMPSPNTVTSMSHMPIHAVASGEDAAWVYYSFRASDQYANPNENIEVTIEVKPTP